MRYTATVGQKFNADGTARPFPGNTILCMIHSTSPTYERVVWLHRQLAAQPFAQHFVLLPPSSFHMTVMDLLCDDVRDPAYWSHYIEPTLPFAEVDAFLRRMLTTVAPPPTLRMKYSGLSTGGGVRIDVAPADRATHRALWQYREAVATATGIRFPTHDSYGFHITLAYRLIEPEPQEKETIAVWVAQVHPILQATFGIYDSGEAELSYFDDIVRFVPEAGYHTLHTR